jgi:hypothetical protein
MRKVELSMLKPIFTEVILVNGVSIKINFTEYHPGCSFGEVYYNLNEIWLSAQSNFELTLYHELAHWLAWYYYSDTSSEDYTGEQLVQFAACVSMVAVTPQVQDLIAKMRSCWPQRQATEECLLPPADETVPTPP